MLRHNRSAQSLSSPAHAGLFLCLAGGAYSVRNSIVTTALTFFSIDDVSYMPQLEVWVELGLVI